MHKSTTSLTYGRYVDFAWNCVDVPRKNATSLLIFSPLGYLWQSKVACFFILLLLFFAGHSPSLLLLVRNDIDRTRWTYTHLHVCVCAFISCLFRKKEDPCYVCLCYCKFDHVPLPNLHMCMAQVVCTVPCHFCMNWIPPGVFVSTF